MLSCTIHAQASGHSRCSSPDPHDWASAVSSARTLWALVVHPRYRHTLPAQPQPAAEWMDFVPDEVLMHIAHHVKDAPSLLNLSRVNKRCRAICCAEALWQDLCMDKFGAPPYSTNDAAFTWKELYRFNHELLYKCILAQAAEALGSRSMRSAAAAGPIHLHLRSAH